MTYLRVGLHKDVPADGFTGVGAAVLDLRVADVQV